jgi:hypothetical protein
MERGLLHCTAASTEANRDTVTKRMACDLIYFHFLGPLQGSSRGNLPAEVKQVVGHGVGHRLGHDEGEINELGPSPAFEDIA